MADVFDMQIIINSLFLGILNCLQLSEKEINQNIFNQNKILINRIKQLENFGTSFLYGCIKDIKKRLDKMDIGDDIIARRINGAVKEITEGQQDLNEDIINLIKNNFDNMFSLFNNKINEMKDYFKNIKNDISTNHLHKSSSKNNKKEGILN